MRRAIIVWLASLCLPAFANSPPQVALDTPSLPAQEEAATLLRVQAAGRFALAAHSSSGAALQLVDMLAGPGDVSGEAGAQDGRIDTLLEAGTYKLRVFSAKNATGAVSLIALPFRDAAPPAAMKPPGILFSADLADLRQRSFWITVPPPGTLRIAATGRALSDLVLFRDGRDLVPLPLVNWLVEPVKGHPLTELVVDGKIEPGTYLVTAYGGKPAIWADGDTANPFYIRAGFSPALAAGWAGGTIGPSGSEVFTLPAWAGAVRLDLPQSAAADLISAIGQESIDGKSREPNAILRVDPAKTPTIELRGAAGQPFTLRCIQTQAVPPQTPGIYWMSASTLGVGGDEVPPTLLLVRHDPAERPRILAGTVPNVGPGLAWHTRFNLRGPTDLLVQPTQGGPLALRTEGVKVGEKLDPNSYVDVPGDLLHVDLLPAAGAFGVLDLTFGPPGLQAPLADPLPPDPVIPLGIQSLWPNQSFSLVTQFAPGAETWLSARKIPVALENAPLIVTQARGQSLTIPVTLPPHATLAASVIGSRLPLEVGLTNAPNGGLNVTLPGPSAARTVILSAAPSAPPPTPPPAPPQIPAGPPPPLATGQPRFFNLAENETRSFALHAPQGGQYRIETLGRLQTSGEIGTHFIASFASAQANGAGHNMRLTPWLRAGDYTIRVTAQSGTGHLGLLAAPAPLVQTATLTDGGSVRATLAAGTGRLIPIEIAADSTYQLSVLGQGEGFSGRLEDEQGWPLIAPGALEELTVKLRPGRYRLIVTPGATAQRMVAKLERIVPETPITGHGPHALILGRELSATWHEPKPGDPNRTPDIYMFGLAGEAHADIALSDGMQGVLTGPATIRLADHFHGVLPPGDWRLAVTARGRNDLLGYTVRVDTDEVQPGIPRDVVLGSSTPFTIAASRVVTLTTTGRAATKAVLRSASGEVIARAGARADDWNTALSQRLPAGAYTVEILPGLPPSLQNVPQPQFPQPDANGGGGGDTQAADESQPTDASANTTLHLDLPPDLPPVPATASRMALGGEGVHVVSLPVPPAGGLIVAETEGAADGVVALERQDAGGAWRMVAHGSGGTAFAAAVADGRPAPWRATIWSLDPSAATISAALRTITEAPRDALTPQSGLGVAVAGLDLANPSVLDVAGPPGLMQAGFPGHAANPLADGHALPQGNRIWFIGAIPGPIAVKPADESSLTLDIPQGAKALLPSGPASRGIVRVWRADAGDGQPALANGADTGAVAPASATLLDGAAPVLRNAGAAAVMRAHLERHDLAVLPALTLGDALSIRIPAGHAVPVETGGARGDLQLSLSPGLAAFMTGQGGVWAPVTTVTRTLSRGPRILLANLGGTPGIAGISPVPHLGAVLLGAGTVEKRFFGASGSFELPAEGVPGAMLHVAGEASLFVRDAAGKVLGGSSVAIGPGRAQVVVTHGRGLVVLWMEAPGTSAWPAPLPADVALPGTVPLSGPAMALRISGTGTLLLHATTTSPVLLGLAGEPPEVFSAGAAFHRAIDAQSILRIISPQDGPLSGTLALSAEPLRPLHEGLGEQVSVPPGGTAAFAFVLTRTATIGIGLRAEPDRARVRVLSAAGRVVGEGVAQLLPNLAPGAYVLEARVPPEAPTTLLRPALFGTVPRASGPPPEIVRTYLEEAGLKPAEIP